MPPFQWNDEYSIQIDSIDAQHKNLISIINELHDAHFSKRGNQIIESILIKLTNYTQTHFSQEELLMKTAGYPDLEEHKKIHIEFISKINEIKTKFNEGQTDLSRETFKFLVNWLLKHIQGADMKYSPYVKSIVVE